MLIKQPCSNGKVSVSSQRDIDIVLSEQRAAVTFIWMFGDVSREGAASKDGGDTSLTSC